MPFLNRFSIIAWLIGAALFPLAQATENNTNEAFWNSVYEENHVVQIDISASREAWEAMQPRRVERKPGGPSVHFGNKFGYAKADIMIDGKRFKDAGPPQGADQAGGAPPLEHPSH